LADTFAAYAAAGLNNTQLYKQTHHQAQHMVSLVERLEQSYDHTLITLSSALDVRDRETKGHSQRVADLFLVLVREMDLPEAQWTNLYRGALLHDVGKIGVPDAILHKPGKLDKHEWEVMRQHPEIGYHILQNVDFLGKGLDIVRYHQEKYDGTGYPHQLVGEKIPLAARIFSIVDAYDAMTSDRPYREALSHEKALQKLRENAGTQFDPQGVEAFLKLVERGLVPLLQKGQ